MKRIISPSMLSADFGNLERDTKMIDRSQAEWVHIDVMDGVFVPNISMGVPVVEAFRKGTTRILDVHLMIVHPEKYVDRFAKVGVEMLSFHLNAVENPGQVLAQICAAGMKPGLAINPDIPVESLFPYLDQCHYVVLMSVFAGFGGQKFIEATYERIRTLKAEIERQGLDIKIEVDGGVSASNAAALAEAGAEIFVAGSAVFKAENPAEVIAAMRG